MTSGSFHLDSDDYLKFLQAGSIIHGNLDEEGEHFHIILNSPKNDGVVIITLVTSQLSNVLKINKEEDIFVFDSQEIEVFNKKSSCIVFANIKKIGIDYVLKGLEEKEITIKQFDAIPLETFNRLVDAISKSAVVARGIKKKIIHKHYHQEY